MGLITLFVFLFSATACAKKKLFYFKEISPPHVQSETALQKTTGYPPLLRPKGKRKTIRPGSQYFKLAIPNAVDMSGRAQDLQQSLADMFYTELFATGRFNLLDRGELVNLDPEWLSTSLKKSIVDLTEQQKPEEKKEKNKSETTANAFTMFESTFKYLDRKEDIKDELLKVLSGADGILLVYITSRVGADKGGHFYVDYRIISKPSPKSPEIVIFAASKKIKYQSSTTQEVAYSREDIRDIAKNIVSIFPHPNEVKNTHLIKRDQDLIVMDSGRDQRLIPGMMGYVVYSEDGTRVEAIREARHYSSLGKFVITEVFDKTATAVLIPPAEGNADYEFDVEVGDAVILK